MVKITVSVGATMVTGTLTELFGDIVIVGLLSETERVMGGAVY
jgi:hypothetical protein